MILKMKLNWLCVPVSTLLISACGVEVNGPDPAPTQTPTTVPSTVPTVTPTTVPSTVPTATPTTVPSTVPTATPTTVPSTAPTATPTPTPTSTPDTGDCDVNNDSCPDLVLPEFKVESDFFNDTSAQIPAERRRTLDNYNGNDSTTLNNLILELNNAGGGIIDIPAGTWEFGGIRMRSNVHLFIDPNAVIKFARATNDSNGRIFHLGYDNSPQVTNVSIRSTSATESFVIDLSDLAEPYPVYPLTSDATVRQEPRVMPFKVSDVDNFMINGVHVEDKWTIHSSVNFVPSTRSGLTGGERYKGAVNGLVKNITVNKAHGGYGAVQTRVGKNVLFKNIDSFAGGTTLRLESDAPHASGQVNGEYRAPIETMIIEDIFGYNIGCTDGNSAVMIQPWYAKNGLIDVQKISSTSCMASVRIDRSFVNWQQPIGSLNNPEHPVGDFDPRSRVSEISATYGTTAQVKQGSMPFIHSSLCHVYQYDILMESFHNGPTISPLMYGASSDTRTDERLYVIRVPDASELDVNSSGFPGVSRTITRAEHYTSNCPGAQNQN